MSGLDDPVVQGVGDVEALTSGSLFLGLKTPETGGRILMQGRQEGKEPSLVRRQQLFFSLGGGLRLPSLNVSKDAHPSPGGL